MNAKLWVVVAVGFLLAADEVPEAAKKDLEKLQGSWTTVELQYNGKDKLGDGKLKLRFVIKDDQASIESSDAVKKEYAKIRLKLDPTTTPPCLDMTIVAGIQKDAVIEGIYELKKDELKICAKVFGKDRPGEFTSPEGSSIVLLVLKRDQP